jgi:hypothetical protein
MDEESNKLYPMDEEDRNRLKTTRAKARLRESDNVHAFSKEAK